MVIFMIWHIFRVRRDGGIAVPPPELRTDNTRITRFELVRREVLAMILAFIFLLILSAFVPAPLAAPIQEGSNLQADARAPWFFLWVQQMLKIGDPFIFGVLVPLIVLTIMATIPYFLPTAAPDELGKWFPKGNRIAQVLTVILGVAIIGLSLLTLLPAK
jgi:hypothetical protein